MEVGRLRHNAAELFGREKEMDRLDKAWDDNSCNVMVIKAWGGSGKTSLVAAWMDELAWKGWREARRVFDWSFYSQGTRETGDVAVSADVFIERALTFFGDDDPTAGSPHDRGTRLANLVAREKSLLLLDGVEPLQHPPGPVQGHLTDPALAMLLKGLAAQNAGLCIVTTREQMPELAGRKTVDDWPLEHLSDEAGAALLHSLGVRRAGAVEIPHDHDTLKTAVREVAGHALTLSLMGRFLALELRGDIQQRDTFRFEEADPEWITTPDPDSPYGHAFKVIAAYERWFLDERAERSANERLACRRQLAVLRLLGLFNRPASADCLESLRREPVIEGLTDELAGLSQREWNACVTRLAGIELVSLSTMASPGRRSGSTTAWEGHRTTESTTALRGRRSEPATASEGRRTLDAHPIIRTFFAAQLREQQPQALRAAHTRLFDHQCEHTEHQRDTLEGLQPLYQAIVHGCLAGRQQEACEKVYRDRILRGTGPDGFYSADQDARRASGPTVCPAHAVAIKTNGRAVGPRD